MAHTREQLEAELAMLDLTERHFEAKQARQTKPGDAKAAAAYQAATDALQAARAVQRADRIVGGTAADGNVTITPNSVGAAADTGL